MITNDDTALRLLAELETACHAAELGYQFAADHVAEPELVELFESYALQRAKFSAELEERIRVLRGTPPKREGKPGTLPGEWRGLAAAADAGETHAILAECERGEDASVKAYATALGESRVDAQTREVIQRQYEFVQAAHDRVRQLRDSATYAHR